MDREANFFDRSLERRLRRLIPEARWPEARARLEEMGRLAAGPIDRLAREADRNPPALVNWNADGRRIDEVRFHASYEEMRRLAYGSGVIAGAYREPREARDPHALTFGLGLLFGMAENGLFCPICMTDGAARVLDRFAPPEVARRFVPRLGAREAPVWEGAMWLTERQGGSDVGANETRARPAPGVAADAAPGSAWLLTGEKWFCSNLGSEVNLALARPEGAAPGTKGLGIYLVPLHLEDGTRNPGLRFRRLKDKLGTRSMPTGEVELEDARAILVAGPGPGPSASLRTGPSASLRTGFKAMLEMIAMSRLYNAVGSVAIMRRAWREAARYAGEREAFGRRLAEHPLHQEIVADLAVECEGATALAFEAIRRLDRIDSGPADGDDKAVWRALTPLAKLHTAKKAIWAASEAVEALGGNGYVEEQVTPRLLRDAQVLPIWEGTTNILSLDFLSRVCAKERGHEALERFAAGLLDSAAHPLLDEACVRVRADLDEARRGVEAAFAAGPEDGARGARGLAMRFARAVAASLLLAEARRDMDEDGSERASFVALRFAGAAPALDRRRYRAIIDA